jgi:hypothetical protein
MVRTFQVGLLNITVLEDEFRVANRRSGQGKRYPNRSISLGRDTDGAIHETNLALIKDFSFAKGQRGALPSAWGVGIF